MKIWIHRYELKPREAKAKPRSGALVKTEWVTGQFGFSDIHPWPEFGEDPLEKHLESLKALQFTKLVENSMEFNYQDREYRLLKRNAFLGLILPRAHKLVFDIENLTADRLHKWFTEGFSHIKVKLGRNLPSETERLVNLAFTTKMMWRLDFNGRVSQEDFTRWWGELDPAVKSRIDFIEDPCASGELKTSGPWANDWKKQAKAAIRIVKPARETSDEVAHYDRVIFTHGLDHPFGQATALWAAARFYGRHPRKMEVCGLGATDFFEPEEFSRAWNCDGPRMKPTEGTGFGFDALLAELAWESLL